MEFVKMRLLYTLFILSILSQSLFGQSAKILQLVDLRIQTLEARTDIERKQYNTKFDSLLNELLQKEDPFLLPLDSVPKIGILHSSDEKIRLITWNLPQDEENRHIYFGYLIYRNKHNLDIFKLTDNAPLISSIDYKELNHNNWRGALYYDIIGLGKKKDATYVLLGWDGNNNYVTIKLVEILHFDKSGNPKFGKSVFEGLDKEDFPVSPLRYALRYSSEVTATLIHRPNEKRIIFDHLSPLNPSVKGIYEYYGPDFTYDAFYFEKDKLVFKQDVEFLGPKNNKKYLDPNRQNR